MTDPEKIAAHLKARGDVEGVLVFDGNADAIVARLVAEGWKFVECEDVCGKRIRYLEAKTESEK